MCHQILFIRILSLLFCCQNQPPQPSQVATPVAVLDSTPVEYPPVPLPAGEIYGLEDLAHEMLYSNSIRFDSLCLIEKEMPVDDIVDRMSWCAKCDGKVAVRFELNEEQGNTEYLRVGKNYINLKELIFQPTGGHLDTLDNYLYEFSCEEIQQFKLSQDSFLTFPARIFFCNGSGCGQHFEFLYHFNTKQLYAFDIYRGRGFFGDANSDNVVDYMEIRPKDSWQTLDTISARFYTLDFQKRLFELLKNEKREDAVIWLAALDSDDYRFTDKLKIISP